MSSPAHPELLIAAAADLAPLQPALAAEFERATGIRARFTLGSSGMLAQQIRHGAPFDVYLSANQKYVEDLAGVGRIARESVTTYAFGRLGLWSRNGEVRDLAALKRPGVRRIAIANPAHAPYGVAARQALENQGLWNELAPRIVYGENVRQALQFAESGNADAVITAWSLLYDRQAALLPEAWHEPIRQAGGVVAASRQREAARRFLGFLKSPAGRAVLKRFGLFPPD